MASSAATNSESSVKKIYLTVIDEVLTNVREAFLDEGYDEQLLQELKQLWENKLNASRAVQTADDSANTNGNSTTAGSGAPTTATNNSSSSGGGGSLRLPTVTKESAAANRASGGGAGNGMNNQNNAPVNNNTNNSDIKPDMDSATRSALHALSQSAYPNQHHHQQHHHNQQQPHHDTNIRTNGKKPLHTPQLDGGIDGSSSDDDDDEDGLTNSMHGDEDEDDNAKNDDHSECEGKEDPDPLNSDDDLTEQGSPDSQSDLFDTDHVIVCQYDKITRIKNRWKFHLKDGIMNINGRDYLFSKANGDAEW